MRPLFGSLFAFAISFPGCVKSSAPRLPDPEPPAAAAGLSGERGDPDGRRPAALAAGPNVGQLALEISGVDLDGAPMRLSDYRGKVVVLDFWGHW